MRSLIRQHVMIAAAAASLLGTALPASAQDAASAPTAVPATPASLSKADQKKQVKAQKKAERKEARAKKNAELKKLEDAGYKPAQNDPNYPTNLQNAEKKVQQQGQ